MKTPFFYFWFQNNHTAAWCSLLCYFWFQNNHTAAWCSLWSALCFSSSSCSSSAWFYSSASPRIARASYFDIGWTERRVRRAAKYRLRPVATRCIPAAPEHYRPIHGGTISLQTASNWILTLWLYSHYRTLLQKHVYIVKYDQFLTPCDSPCHKKELPVALRVFTCKNEWGCMELILHLDISGRCLRCFFSKKKTLNSFRINFPSIVHFELILNCLSSARFLKKLA